MSGPASDLDPAAITAELTRLGCALGNPCSVAPVTASTNDDARAAARMDAAHGAVFLADAQTSGRGRSGHAGTRRPARISTSRSFFAPRWPTERLSTATLAAGVAVARAVDAELPPGVPRARLKWPNDVLVGGRKIAGILAEAQLRGAAVGSLVVGVGLNVDTSVFPDELADTATSLARLGVASRDRSRLAGAPDRGARGSRSPASATRAWRRSPAKCASATPSSVQRCTSPAARRGRRKASTSKVDCSCRTADGSVHAVVAGEALVSPP